MRYTTLAVLRDFAADGVVYLELRTTPRAMPAAGLTEDGYVQTVLDAIAEFESEQGENLEKPEGHRRVGLKTKLILSVSCAGLHPRLLHKGMEEYRFVRLI